MSLSQVQENDFLDLTKIKLPDRKGIVLTEGGGSSGSHDTPFPRLPLEITLINLNKGSYQMGEPVIYDVAIKNVGPDPIVIPWSPIDTRSDQMRLIRPDM